MPLFDGNTFFIVCRASHQNEYMLTSIFLTCRWELNRFAPRYSQAVTHPCNLLLNPESAFVWIRYVALANTDDQQRAVFHRVLSLLVEL